MSNEMKLGASVGRITLRLHIEIDHAFNALSVNTDKKRVATSQTANLGFVCIHFQQDFACLLFKSKAI